jgi:hypothetical protein
LAFAVAVVAATACGGGVDRAAPNSAGADAEAPPDAPSATAHDAPSDTAAAIDSGIPGPNDVDATVCTSRSGYFFCADNVCSRAIQACSEGECSDYGAIAPMCGECPTCDCLNNLLNLASCTDDGAGGLTFTLLPPGGYGARCKQDTDCQAGLCENGACVCKPAGAMATSRNGLNDCCGWYLLGTCVASAGSSCAPNVPDCYGGPCTNGQCACVGPAGYCNADTDCCAGATRCVQEQCQ